MLPLYELVQRSGQAALSPAHHLPELLLNGLVVFFLQLQVVYVSFRNIIELWTELFCKVAFEPLKECDVSGPL